MSDPTWANTEPNEPKPPRRHECATVHAECDEMYFDDWPRIKYSRAYWQDRSRRCCGVCGAPVSPVSDYGFTDFGYSDEIAMLDGAAEWVPRCWGCAREDVELCEVRSAQNAELD